MTSMGVPALDANRFSHTSHKRTDSKNIQQVGPIRHHSFVKYAASSLIQSRKNKPHAT